MKLPHTEIAVRAVKDTEFRKQLEAKPRQTIEQSFDIQIPNSVKLRVVEDSADRVHLVIPAAPGERGKEVGLIALILKEMRQDPRFKARVISDPKGTFEKRTGLSSGIRPRSPSLNRPPTRSRSPATGEQDAHLHRRPGGHFVRSLGRWRRWLRRRDARADDRGARLHQHRGQQLLADRVLQHRYREHRVGVGLLSGYEPVDDGGGVFTPF